jgi:hypothetical protein
VGKFVRLLVAVAVAVVGGGRHTCPAGMFQGNETPTIAK